MTGRTGKLTGQRTCEATVGFDERRHMLIRCKEPATLLFLPDSPPPPNQPPLVWVALCERCLLSLRCEGDISP